MATLTVRNIPDDVMARLGDLAAAEHTSMEALVREQIIGLSGSALQKSAYTIHFLRTTDETSGQYALPLVSGVVLRRRTGSVQGSCIVGAVNLADAEAYQEAVRLAERNHAGDRERIIAMLGKQFDQVIEAPAED